MTANHPEFHSRRGMDNVLTTLCMARRFVWKNFAAGWCYCPISSSMLKVPNSSCRHPLEPSLHQGSNGLHCQGSCLTEKPPVIKVVYSSHLCNHEQENHRVSVCHTHLHAAALGLRLYTDVFSVCPCHVVKSQPVVVGLNAPLIEDYIIHACK